ncbi:MAG: Phage portal protein family [Frondihabitans sp.]|nr:Phage portal protein family [Frondihabitans sp.]
MSFWSRTHALLSYGQRSDASPTPESGKPLPGIVPNGRERAPWVSQERALTLSTVFRAVQIHATAVSQLSLQVERQGQTVADTPSLVRKPSLSRSRSRFLEEITCALYLDGNAFLRIVRGPSSEVVDLDVLDPRKVSVRVDGTTGRKTFGYGTRNDLTTSDIAHLKFLSLTGVDRGLGPIQAAQMELAGALDARDYGSGWFNEGSMPSGILKTDQILNSEQAANHKRAWNGLDDEGQRVEGWTPHDTKVLGAGLNYVPLLLKPADIQFLETQQFTTTQIARLMGVPSSLFLAAVEGGGQTYSNVEQDWIGYVRFSLMNVLREIEETLSELTPRGQSVRFNIDALLRTDTKTRYESHAIALNAGFKTDDEVRENEGLPPFTPEQRAQVAARKPATAPAKQETPSA